MATIICPHCGTANRAGANFCNTCGTDLRMDETPPSPVAPMPDADPAPKPADESTTASPSDAEEPPVREEADTQETGSEETLRSAEEAEFAPLDDDLTFPFFDLGLASPGDEDEPWFADQPWLQDEPDRLADAEASDAEGIASSPAERRLITGAQGLLAPLNITSRADAQPLAPPPSAPPETAIELSSDQMRRFRRLMIEEPKPGTGQIPQRRPRWPSLRIPWIFWLMGLAVAIPVALLLGKPTGAARLWPGVNEAYLAVESLPSNATVLAYWAYDPATAGELDMVAEPVVHHLLERRAQLVVASTLPGGPASARRLVADALHSDTENSQPPNNRSGRIRSDQKTSRNVTLAIAESQLVANIFLPGGVVALPLLAQDLQAVVSGASTQSGADQQAATVNAPDLTIVFAAESEDVQHWLEQVQPLNNAPVIAVTSAGVDPLVRPYLDSGQLRGLVSGFDGAYNYEKLRNESRTVAQEQRARQRLVAQNWGQIALLIIVGLGNLAAVLGRRREA